MRRKFLTAASAAVLAISAIAFVRPAGSITGKVIPADGAQAVWAINGTDSFKALIQPTGGFRLDANAGNYKVIVDAIGEYKDATLENVALQDGQVVDLGEIKLEK